ncbi:thioredoxin family protein [Pantoea sp. MBD-2R]|uniref:thioredoxin family protein n=1 Tax=unclassified Pantoea TaxID=2630326 RepID=UPI0011BDD35A|nr:thioredoxin family protein [Pantoea sp. CCBC3-3-1]
MMINFKELFSAGASFNAFATTGLAGEIKAVEEARTKLASLPESLKEEVRAVQGNYYLLTAAELWCPDCQRNVTAMQFLSELQPTIQQAIISKSRAERSLMAALQLEKIPVPFTAILNADFELLGTFVERPQAVINGDDEVLQRYRQGELLGETVKDILAVIQQSAAA